MDAVLQVQHLLRHLNDLSGLRNSPLVRGLFARGDVADHELHAHIRQIVVREIDNLASIHGGVSRTDAERWQSIVRRCDLEGELHKNVASDLGLGKRQFYRVRRRMHEILLKALVRELEGLSNPSVYRTSQSELAIDLSRGLRDYGRIDEALSLLLDIATSAPEPGQRLSAITELSDAYGELDRPDRIQPLLESAHALCYGPPASGDPLHEAEVHMTESAFARARQDVNGYIGALQRAQLRSLNSGPSHRAIDINLKATLELADAYLGLGRSADAEEQCVVARQRLNHRSGFMRRFAALRIVQGDLAERRSAPAEAMVSFAEALTAAREANIPRYGITASQRIGSLQMAAENWHAAHQHIRNAVVFNEALAQRAEAAEGMLMLAWLENASYLPQNATDTLKEVRRNYPDASERPSHDIFLASSLAQMGRVPEAVSLIDTVWKAVRDAGMYDRLGACMELERAEIYSFAGRSAEARGAIAQSVELSETPNNSRLFGCSLPALRIYRLSAELTGNIKHKSIAAELKELTAAIA